MKSHLEDRGYSADPDTGVWKRAGYKGIPYNDGDAVERSIERILGCAEDVSLGSVELRDQCVDWPTLYHFSDARANVLRPVRSVFRGEVLEVGSGCGAITRFLGETGAQVTALEGSLRRARITRLRTRGLPNVTVVAENIKQFETTARFDVVTLIGVLEYANLFFGSDTGCDELLARLVSLLKPDGRLIIAIENQLGLKYFAGGHEDHLAEAMVGLEDRYESKGVRTFGKRALNDLLAASGLSRVEFLYPFPDYKLPRSVITEAGFADVDFDPRPLICGARDTHARQDQPVAFFPNLVWPQILRNGLGEALSNSFVAVASGAGATAVDRGLLAVHYSTARQPALCKRAEFRRAGDGVQVESHRLNGERAVQSILVGGVRVRHHILACDRYHAGAPLSDRIYRCLTRAGWHLDELATVFSAYLGHVDDVIAARALATMPGTVPGECLDLVPQNLIVDARGGAQPFDLEWLCDEPIPRAYLFFRAVFVSLCALDHCAPPAANEPQDWRNITLGLARRCGIELNERTYLRYLEREFAFQRAVSGSTPGSLLETFDRTMPVKRRADQVLRALPAGVDLAAERAAHLARIDALETALNTLEASASWQLTAPLRRLSQRASHVRRRGRELALAGLKRARDVLWVPRSLDAFLVRMRQQTRLEHAQTGTAELPPDAAFQTPSWAPVEAERLRVDVFVWADADWPDSALRTQQLALSLAKRGHRVFHVSGSVRGTACAGFEARPVAGADRLYELSVGLPTPADVSDGDVPSTVLTQLMVATRNVHAWTRSEHSLSLVSHAGWGQVAIGLPREVTVYDRVDLHTAGTTVSPRLAALDRELMQLADVTLSSTALMAQDAETVASLSVIVRDAADEHLIAVEPVDVVTHAADRKAIGYLGGVDDTLDSGLIGRITERFPDCDVVLFTEGRTDVATALRVNPNVVIRCGLPASEMATQLQCMDVCIVPHRMTRTALTASPAPVFTYLCLGKPVVATDLPEMQFFADVIDIAADDTAFLRAVASGLSEPDNSAARAKRVAFGRGQRWDDRASQIMAVVEGIRSRGQNEAVTQGDGIQPTPPVCS